MRPLKPIILFLITLFLCKNVVATEIIGGSLRYEALGNQKYKIIGTINRNCAGSTLTLPVFGIYSGTTSYTLNVTRSSIKDITNYCKTTGTPCAPANTTNKEGQEQHTFETTVDFNIYPFNTFYNNGTCEVIFSMESCCRSSKTTNMSANNFYLEAMLNLCVLGKTLENSSTERTPPSYIEMCANIPFTYSFGYYEKDGDSLLHTLETPKKSNTLFESFINPLTAQFPMTPFCLPPGVVSCKALPNAKPPRGIYFDSNTGDMIITPTVLNEKAIISLRTTEYRTIDNKMTRIGYSTTELFVNVRACSDNNIPVIPTANKWSVCEGDKLCFIIKSTDTRTPTATVDDTTYLSWNNGVPAAKFTIIDPTTREKQAEFCWQTKIGDARPYEYQFAVTATDSNCEQPLITTRAFVIMVKPKAKATRQYKKFAGNQLVFEGKTPDSLNYTYEWQIRDSMQNLPLYKTFKRLDSFKFKDTGKYFITMIINNFPYNCPTTYVDTIHMDGSITTSIIPIALSAIRIYPNPTNGLINIDLNKDLHWTEMKLFNSIGQLLFTGPVETIFDMGKYPSGHYTLELMGDEGKFTATLIKE